VCTGAAFLLFGISCRAMIICSSLSTVQREYGALMGVAYYDLFQSVMDPPRRPLYSASFKDINEVMRTYEVNEPQARAIYGSLQATGFSLIQGQARPRSCPQDPSNVVHSPPGTGKTSTIMGLVGTFLSKRPPPTTRIQAGRPPGPGDKEPPKKILICAPSNAAIDEVASRLKQGIRVAGGTTLVPKIVRVGNEEKMSPLVKDLSLDELVGAMLSNDPKAADLSTLRGRLKTLTAKIDANLKERSAPGTDESHVSSLEADLRDLRNERARLVRQLDAAKDENENIRRNRDSNMRKYEAQVLQDADVICATLSGSGHSSLTPFTFETVIIDEAAQSVELSSLIPLKYGTKQAILVGGLLPFLICASCSNLTV
jgi:senataxin